MAKQGEIGAIGISQSTIFSNHLSTQEYLSVLSWPDDIKIYNKMRRSDAQIKAMLLCLELPIRSTEWYIEPADNSSKAKEIAEFIENNLFTGPPNGMSMHFDDFVRNACTMFSYGHSIFEKVYKVDNGYLKWRKFAPRPASTIYDFLYDDNGGPLEIQQYKYSNTYEIVNIPIDKLLIFSHRMEEGDLRGNSVLRSAYKHWKIKDFVYKILNVGIERNLVGTPIVKLPQTVTDTEMDRARQIIKQLRSSDMGGAHIPAGFELDLFEGKRGVMEVMPYITHQDMMIVRSVLAQFINLGSDGGSYALSKDQSDLFLMMLGAEAKYIANTVNSYAIPQLVGYNFDSDLCPTLGYKPLGGSNKMLEALKLLVDGKLIAPDEKLEEWLRDLLDLPEKDINTTYTPESKLPNLDDENMQDDMEDEVNKAQNQEDIKDGTKIEDEIKIEDESNKTKKMSEYKWKRDLTTYEQNVNLSEIDKAYDTLEEAFKRDGNKIINKQISDLQKRVKGTDIDNIASIPIRFKAEMTKFIFNHMKKSLNIGIKQARIELDAPEPDIDIKIIQAQAAIMANNISERVKTKFLSEYLKDLGTTTSVNKASSTARKVLKR